MRQQNLTCAVHPLEPSKIASGHNFLGLGSPLFIAILSANARILLRRFKILLVISNGLLFSWQLATTFATRAGVFKMSVTSSSKVGLLINRS